MRPIRFADDLLTGDDRIDADHRRVVDMINQMLTSETLFPPPDRFAEAIRTVFMYVCRHFENEEALAQRHGYPDLERLKASHDRFRLEGDTLAETLESEGPSRELWLALHVLVVDRFTAHIRGEDRKLAGFLAESRVKDA